MSQTDIINIANDTIWIILKSALPLLLVSLLVGLIVSLFQTLTSIQEATLTFVPKLLAIFIMILLIGPWIINSIVEFMGNIWTFSNYVR